jgi:hypothetical protein
LLRWNLSRKDPSLENTLLCFNFGFELLGLGRDVVESFGVNKMADSEAEVLGMEDEDGLGYPGG